MARRYCLISRKSLRDCFPFLKSAPGFVNALIKHYEVVVEWEEFAQFHR